MSQVPKILAFAGSVRKESFNRKLLQIAAAGAREAGAEVTVLELADYPLPLFDQDLEAEKGAPENAVKLKQIFGSHQALLIASPEYNSSITPLMKNTIDWVSRASATEPALAAFQGKIASLISASPGALGGIRGLVTLRSLLGNIGVIVLPEQMSISQAGEAFNPDGSLKNEKQQSGIKNQGSKLVERVRKFTS